MATEVELQPNIDGLSFDEVLLIGLVPRAGAVLATWYVTRGRRRTTDRAADRTGETIGRH